MNSSVWTALLPSPRFSGHTAGIVAAVVIAATTLLVAICRRRLANAVPASHDQKEVLLKIEQGLAWLGVDVTAVTFYRGNDGVPPTEFIAERIRQILCKNPSLLGRLHSTGDGNVVLTYSSEYKPESEVNPCVMRIAGDGKIHLGMDYMEMNRAVKEYKCVKDWKELFKVTLFPRTDSEGGWAMMVSMAHAIGDGATFYQIQSMLDVDNQVYTLDAKRKHEFDTCRECFGMYLNESWCQTLRRGRVFLGGALWAFLGKVFPTSTLPKIEGVLATVDQEFIADKKRKYGNGGDFVSTNDIITSWFFDVAPSPIMLMAVNLRPRLKWLSTLGANYLSIAAYSSGRDPTSPRDIRSSLTTYATQGSPQSLSPSIYESLKCPTTLITNWVSFCNSPKFVDSQAVLHLPLMFCDERSRAASLCVIFCSRPGEVSIVAVNATGLTHNIQAHPIIGKSLLAHKEIHF